MSAFPTQIDPSPAPTGDIPTEPLPPLPSNDPSGAEVLPLVSNGFEVGGGVAAAFPVWAAVLSITGIVIALIALGLSIYAHEKNHRRGWLWLKVAIGGLAICLAGIVGGHATAGSDEAKFTGSAPQLVKHAEANYQVEITADQARALLNGDSIAVDYLGSRIAVEAALGADGKLYLLGADGFQLPATDEQFGIPAPDASPLPEK